MQRRRIVVIGGGVAGREAARHAARRGSDVALVTERLSPGDRLDAASIRFLAREAPRIAEAWEPEGPSPGPEYAPAMRETLATAMDLSASDFADRMSELQAAGVRIVEGTGRVEATDIVAVTRPDGETECLPCSAIILATGVRAFLGERSPCALTPSSMRSLSEVPESLIVLGSSPSTLEFAYFCASYGTEVTMIGARRPALHFLDPELRDKVTDRAADNLIRIITGATAVAGTTNGRVDLLLSDESHVDADCVISCGEGGCRTDGLGLDGPGVRTGPDGEVLTDEQMRTNIPEIFAAGSVTGLHDEPVAVRQARVAAENAVGGESSIVYELIPTAAWFDPQIGSVGLCGDAPAGRSSSIACAGAVPGEHRWAKVLTDEQTGRVLGVHLVGDGAVEAVHMGALALHVGAAVSDLSDLAYGTGTMAECIVAAARILARPIPEDSRPLVGSPG